jgi:hypothetical protein
MKNAKTARRSAAAVRTATAKTAALGVVSGQVIARRMALAASGDHAEAGRMLPEKLGAATLSALVVLQHATRMNLRMAGFAAAEAVRIARTAQTMAGATTSAAVFGAQFDFLQAWLPRWQAQSLQIGTALIQSAGAALVPVQRVAAGNARRLAA